MATVPGDLSTTATVELYFDYISPYAWLGLRASEEFGRRHGVAFALKPVVYGVLLDATGLVGPAEVEVKRRYTMVDAARLARAQGLRFEGPPAHPFRSLEALRLTVSWLADERVTALARALAAACWEGGRDLTDLAVLADVAGEVGLETEDTARRVGDPSVKAQLRRGTEAALAAGVFGVPTFRYRGELFWGQDRLPLLAEALRGAPPLTVHDIPMLDRPRGTDRRRAP